MLRAVRMSCFGLDKNCVPVGCVGFYDNIELSSEHNNRYKIHAELLVVTTIKKVLNNNTLDYVTLYVILEPCFMCCFNTRVNFIFFSIFSTFKKENFFLKNKSILLLFFYNYISYNLKKMFKLFFLCVRQC